MKNIKIASMVCAILLGSNLFADQNQTQSQPPKPPVPKADIYIVPAPSDMDINLTYPAQIKAFSDVEVYSRALGVLQKQYFQEGSTVKEGELLYKIEDKTYKTKVEEKQANVKINEAIVNNAKRDWERISKLYEQKVITEEKKDASLFAYEKSLASLDLAKAELQLAKVNLDYTNVKAPISGTIGLQKVDVGDLVTENPPKALVTITRNDKVYIEFSMPLSDYKYIKNGTWTMPKNGKISVNVENKIYQADINFVDVNINQNTSTVKMRAVFDNKENQLMAGNFVRATLEGVKQKDVITIPQKAMLQDPTGTIVMIDNNGTVGVRPVIVGKESGDKYVVVGGMVKSGDRVIVNNFFRIKPNQPVVVDKIINQ